MILFTGRGTSGSWQVRGVQLGHACGAKVKARALPADCTKADIIVAIKRLSPELHSAIKQSKRHWVLDVVDMYPQPACTGWDRQTAINWVRAKIKAYRPTGIVWPNQRMRDDCAVKFPGIVLPHHYRPGLTINPIRDQVKTVGYEGSSAYIGDWLEPILKECQRRGWDFKINQCPVSELDIVIAARGSAFNGYAQRHWKSNVKLANAHGAGTPFIGPRECGYMESATGMEQWADNPKELRSAFDRLSDHAHRQAVSRAFIAGRYSVEDAAADLSAFLISLQ